MTSRLVPLALAWVLAISLLFAGSGLALTVKPGQSLPRAALLDGKGGTVQLSKVVAGKTALIVYWSITCDHCLKEIPLLLKNFKQQKKPGYHLVLIAGDSKEMIPAARSFMNSQKPGKASVLFDSDAQGEPAFGDALRLEYTPTIFVTCPQGRLAGIFEGSPGIPAIMRSIQGAAKSPHCSPPAPAGRK